MRQTLIILMLILSCYQANARGKYDNTDTLIVARDGTKTGMEPCLQALPAAARM